MTESNAATPDEGVKPADPGLFKSSAPTNLAEYYKFVDMLQSKGLIKRPIYPSMLLELSRLRDSVRKEMKQRTKGSPEFMAMNILQASVKLIMVSSYGVVGMHADDKHPNLKSVRFFDQEFFNDVTTTSQDIIKMIMVFAKQAGWEVLYGDTDSIFIKPAMTTTPIALALEAQGWAKQFDDKLKELLIGSFGIDPSEYYVLLEAKNVYEALILTSAKKKYRGEVIWTEGEFGRSVDIMGFESKRADAFPLMAEMQEGCQKILIDSPLDWAIIEQRLLTYYRGLEAQMFSGALDKKLVQEKTVKKTSLEEYGKEGKGVPPHVRAAKQLFDKGALRMGDRVGFVVVKTDKGMVVEAIDPRTPETIPKISVSGYQYYRGRLLDMLQRLVGRAYDEMINAKMDRWFEKHDVGNVGSEKPLA